MSDQRDTGQPQSYTREEVTARGFEARCVTDDHVEYLWHRGCGLRVDHASHAALLVTDPELLPEGPWYATELGLTELRTPGLQGPS